MATDQDPPIDPTDPIALAQEAVRLEEKYRVTGRTEFVERAAEYFRTSLAMLPHDYAQRALVQTLAGICIKQLFDRTGQVQLLDEAEHLGRDALARTLPGDLCYASQFTLLGNVSMARYDYTGRVEALDEALAMHRRSESIATEDPVDRAARLTNLGNVLQRLFRRNGELSVLHEAIEASRNAVAVVPADHPDRARWQTNLVIVLRNLFERTGDTAVLREAVEAGRAAMAATPEDHPERDIPLSTLATALYRLAECTGDVELLTEALDLGRAGVAAIPADHPRRASMLSDFGATARLYYKYTGQTGVLAEAVYAGRAAVEATPIGDTLRPDHLSNLGIASREAFERTGDRELLTEAVKAGHDSVAATPPGHPALVVRATNLVTSLQREFEATGRSDSILEAVAQARAAVEAMPEDLANRGAVLVTLGNVLRTAYQSSGLETALGEAGRVLLKALEATPEGHPDRAGRLNDLGYTAMLLAEHTGLREGFAAAYSFFEQAEALVPPDHPGRLLILSNRAAMALAIFKFDKRPEIGEVAVAALRVVALNTPESDPFRASRLCNLGLALQTLAAERDTNADLLEEARTRFREAANLASASTLVRIQAGREQARLDLAAGAFEAALEAIERVVELIDQLAPASLVRSDRESRMARLDGLPAQAAAIALAAGRPGCAVELLERARGVLVAEALALRGGESARLRAAYPELAQSLDSARGTLTALDQGPESGSVTEIQVLASAAAKQHVAQQRDETRAEIEDVLSRIRALPTFEDFLRPGLTELAACAQAGPVVLVVCTPERCDALIVTGDAAEIVRHVPLPDLNHAAVVERSVVLWNARQRAVSRDLSPEQRVDPEQEIMQVLAWLWDAIAEPVLTALGVRATPGSGEHETRIWWCPVGVAAELPLHAAGHHDDPADRPGGRRTVLDRVVSSYTPTLLALRAAATADAASGPTGETDQTADAPAATPLIIAVPDLPGAPLPGAEREASALISLLPNAHVLSNPTRAEALDALPKHRIAHFACHGAADRKRPRQSHLLLADHETAPLTVADLVQLEFSADLAYLSACDTSVTAPQLADEALHLTGAFHLLGYRHVIGSLWPVDDHIAADLAVDVYTRLAEEGTTLNTKRAAEALHHAVRTVRAKHPTSPSLWAPYTHTGP
ncbi:tetratricopeptide (TPR) repeat protein [Catenulispora sp. EB89]|uniref:CHAT domain-containing protein n=1 Tax=Catenulispora sp. EB89 TaxID=3156257 RepID=UPI00351390FE